MDFFSVDQKEFSLKKILDIGCGKQELILGSHRQSEKIKPHIYRIQSSFEPLTVTSQIKIMQKRKRNQIKKLYFKKCLEERGLSSKTLA